MTATVAAAAPTDQAIFLATERRDCCFYLCVMPQARRTFDRALAALPITQHDRVWVLYLVSGVGTHQAGCHAADL